MVCKPREPARARAAGILNRSFPPQLSGESGPVRNDFLVSQAFLVPKRPPASGLSLADLSPRVARALGDQVADLNAKRAAGDRDRLNEDEKKRSLPWNKRTGKTIAPEAPLPKRCRR
jgi:hypothetical protein